MSIRCRAQLAVALLHERSTIDTFEKATCDKAVYNGHCYSTRHRD